MARTYTEEQRRAAAERTAIWTQIAKQDPGYRARRTAIENRTREKYPEKFEARQIVYRALRKGLLCKPLFCQRCELEKPLEASHDDYSKPLMVEWLCRQCHAKKDRKNP